MNLRTSLVFVFLAGCSTFNADNAPGSGPSNDDGGTAGNGQSPVPGTPALGFSVVPAGDRAFVIQGQSLEIPIRITRKESTTDAVAIAVGGLPAGATVAPLQIPAGSNEGKLKVTVAATTPQGSVDLSISASTGDGSTAKGAVPIFVRGAPGSVDTTFAPGPMLLSDNGGAGGTLTLLADGSMVAAAKVGTGARIVKVDAEGKVSASTDAGVGVLLAPLPDGRFLNFGDDKVARFSAKLDRDTSLGGGTGLLTPAVGRASDVAVSGGKAYLLSTGGTGRTIAVRRFSADGVIESDSCKMNNPADNGEYLQVRRSSLHVDVAGQARVVGGSGDENSSSFVFGCASSGLVNLGGDLYSPAHRALGSNVVLPALVSDGVDGFFVAEGPSNTSFSVRLVHLNASGMVDRGPFTTDLTDAFPIIGRAADGSVILTSRRSLSSPGLRRYKADGTEDATFVRAQSASVVSPSEIVILKDGRIVVLATSNGLLVLVRYWG